MRLICAMLVGPNEADRYLGRALTSARRWADLIVVYGDGCDSATRSAVCERADYATVSTELHFLRDESLVRNRLLELVDKVAIDGDYVVVLDSDEELVGQQSARMEIAELEGDAAEAWNVQFFHLWAEDGSVHRVDGAWQPSIGPRIYRHRRGRRIVPRPMACSPVPEGLDISFANTGLYILHWGYADPADRPAKYERYAGRGGHGSDHIESILREPTLVPIAPYLRSNVATKRAHTPDRSSAAVGAEKRP